VILSFKDAATEDVYHDIESSRSRAFSAIVKKIGRRKMMLIAAATKIQDLKIPPGNHLERLRGDLLGLWSIRINKQWRIVFRWENGIASEVTLTDYH